LSLRWDAERCSSTAPSRCPAGRTASHFRSTQTRTTPGVTWKLPASWRMRSTPPKCSSTRAIAICSQTAACLPTTRTRRPSCSHESATSWRASMADVRTATSADLDGLTELFTAAFSGDPLWRWVYPELADLEVWWRFLITSALRYPNTYNAGDPEAAAVWIPPGGVELTAEQEEQVEPLLEQLIGDRAADVLALLGEFDASHPHDRGDHYYLSLLGTDPARRGNGIGMGLLAHCLDEILDAE